MSLDDKFNPNDGSFIDNLNSALFEFNKKIAVKWQYKTYRSKADLERILYFGSAAAFGYSTITESVFFAFPAAAAALSGSIEIVRPGNDKLEEMECEKIGLPGKTIKYLTVGLYGAGVVRTLVGVGHLVAGAVSGNNELYIDSITNLMPGLGMLGWMSADYMAKSDIGTPPPKPKKKPVLEIIKESVGGLFPQSKPKPVPVRMYSEVQNYSLAKAHK